MSNLKVSGAQWGAMTGITFESKEGWPTLDSFYDDEIDFKEFEARKAKSTIKIIKKGKRQ